MRSNSTVTFLPAAIATFSNPLNCLTGPPGMPMYSCATSEADTEPVFETVAVTLAMTSQRLEMPPWMTVLGLGGRRAVLAF
jgi:hypothetical protein